MRLAFIGAVVVAVSAQVCEPERKCEWTITVGSTKYYYDFYHLCNDGGADYFFTDDAAHEYYANVCGTAAQICLPQDWDNVYQRGVAVQAWGAVPTCDKSNPAGLPCTDNTFNPPQPACCTQNCQVLGVGDPKFNLHRSGDPNQGVEMTFTGAVPAADDPFGCPWDRSTGKEIARTVTFLMDCDPTVATAVAVEAQQNKTDDCDYKLTFKTRSACPSTHGFPGSGGGSLSGGWIFIIILLVVAVVYFGAGTAYTYHKEGVWAPPNRGFWAAFGQYIGDGVSFIAGGCRGLGAGKAPGASPYDEIGGGGGSAPAAAPSAYNASSGTAYTDL